MNRFNIIPRVAALLLVLSVCTANAQYEVAEIPFFDAPPGTAALGGGVRLGQGLYFATDNADQRQFDVVPLYLYNGKFVFFRGSAGGVHLINSEWFELNILGRYRFTKLDPDRNEFYEGISERKQALDGGVEVRLRGDWGALNANFLTDTLDRHAGQSAEISYRYRFDRGASSSRHSSAGPGTAATWPTTTSASATARREPIARRIRRGKHSGFRLA